MVVKMPCTRLSEHQLKGLFAHLTLCSITLIELKIDPRQLLCLRIAPADESKLENVLQYAVSLANIRTNLVEKYGNLKGQRAGPISPSSFVCDNKIFSL